MHERKFAGGRAVSEVGLGAWQLGGADWGDVPDAQAFAILDAAAGAGVSFIDTADVYGLGRSEKLIGAWLKQRKDAERFFVATKLGRFPEPGWPGNFTAEAVKRHVEASIERLGVAALDLVQLHCVPLEAMKAGEMFATLRTLKAHGRIKAFGASVETIEDAQFALGVEGLASLQIIFNILRQPMADKILPQAKAKGVSIIVRLPLASGLLSGRFKPGDSFAEADHRNYNRDGAAFYVGETFAGLPFAKGVELVEKVRTMAPEGVSLADFSLRWCLDNDAVTTIIPGASSPAQALTNARASDMAPLGADMHRKLRAFFDDEVASRIRGPI
jgi:aryl-alcohol dehydrogenase-like predicted oxidoreductase